MRRIERIENGNFSVGVIGLGYVGLPLAVEYAAAGNRTIGFDVDAKKIQAIKNGENYIDDVDDEKLKKVVKNGQFTATTDFSELAKVDAIFIAVPTPFTPNKEPDISYVESAADAISEHLQDGQLIILKSTTYPETTEKVVLPLLEKSGKILGKDFFLAYSPERIDPGNKIWMTHNTPIIVGGMTEKCRKYGKIVVGKVIEKVHLVSNPKVGEMAKLLENIFRSVNIALVNEMAQLCDRMDDIDIWEVVEAAATKPFGFMPFFPGPGIGGHCILVDPYYLSWKAREFDFHSKFIELAAHTNENMPFYVSDMVIRALSKNAKSIHDATIHFLGVAFKRDVDDTRNSPAMRVMEILKKYGAKKMSYSDSWVPEIKINGDILKSKKLTKSVMESADCIVITTDHTDFNFDEIAKNANIIVDTRNAIPRQYKSKKIMRLGVKH